MRLQGEVLQRVAGAYAAGALGRLARRRFEAIMVRDAAARHAWQQWEQRLVQLVSDPPSVRPPDSAWRDIERQLVQPANRRQVPRWWLWALLLLGASVAWVWMKARH